MFYVRRGRGYEQTQAFARLRSVCYVLGIAIVCISALCLIADLGRPERMLNLFLHPRATYISFGTYVLLAITVVGAALAMTAVFDVPRVTGRMKAAGEGLCAVLAVALMTYTGFFLYALKAVPFWDSPLVPVLFVLSALSTGLSVVLMVTPFVRDVYRLGGLVRACRAVHLAVVVLEALAVALYLLWAASNLYVAQSVDLLFQSDLATWFFVGVLGCGIAVPLVAETVAVVSRGTCAHWLLDALVLVGGFSLRYCIVSAGLH